VWKAKPFKVLTGEIARRVRPAEKSFLCFVIYCWWLYEAAKMLFIHIIYSAVFVVKMQYFEKMNSA